MEDQEKDKTCPQVAKKGKKDGIDYFYFDLGKKMDETIVLRSEKMEPSEALTEEIIWDPGTSD